MKYTLVIAIVLSFAPLAAHALTGAFAPGGQYNPIYITVQQDPGQQAQQQFSQIQNALNMQAINEPAACASILAQARSFINTVITQHDGSPTQAVADAYQLNAYYTQNSLCITQQQTRQQTQQVVQRQCAPGTAIYNGSCVSLDTYCQNTAVASERDSVFAKGYNSDGTVNCMVSFAGTGATQQQVQPTLAPAPKPVAQTKKTVSPQAPAPKFYIDDHPDAAITTASEPTTTPPQHHGFWTWVLGLFGL